MFPVSDKHINCKCGLHLTEYQEINHETGKRGFYNSKGKFTNCNSRDHLTREQYNQIIPQIVQEFVNAGCYATIQHFTKPCKLNYYNSLCKDTTSLDEITSQKTTEGNKFLRSYMSHIYETSDYQGSTILNLWTAENLVKAFTLLDQPKYTVNSYLSEILKRLKFSPVTMYPPLMTKGLLTTYDCHSVFDPCVGWGGRMLGTTCLGAHYTGCEPYTQTYQGLTRMINELHLHESTTLYNRGVETMLDELDNQTFDACITSPPYFNLEIYSDESTQSIQKYPTYDEWIHKFIKPIIDYVCSHVTKVSCWSVKNIKTETTYPLLDDVIQLHNVHGWNLLGNHSIKKNVRGKMVDGDITYVFTKHT